MSNNNHHNVRLATDGTPVYKMNTKTLHFNGAKQLLDSFQERFQFQFGTEKKMGFFPLLVSSLILDNCANNAELAVPNANINVLFPIRHHSIEIIPVNDKYPNTKPTAKLVPVTYSAEAVDYDFLQQAQKEEEDYLMDAINALTSAMGKNTDNDCFKYVPEDLDHVRIKLPKDITGLEKLFSEISLTKHIGLRVMGGWVISETNPKDTSAQVVYPQSKYGVSLQLHNFLLNEISVPAPRNLAPPFRKRKVEVEVPELEAGEVPEVKKEKVDVDVVTVEDTSKTV